MVLDPMSALSLAASIVQFVDFSSKLVSKGCHIYRSSDGALPGNLEMEAVAKELSQLTIRLRHHDRPDDLTRLSQEDQALEAVSGDCDSVAKELLSRLEKLKVQKDVKNRGWKSFRQALKSVSSKEELDELSERLVGIRDRLQFHILLTMREDNKLLAIRQSERYDHLDVASKALMQALLSNGVIFSENLNTQTIAFTGLHVDTRTLIRNEAEKTRSDIINALKSSDGTESKKEPDDNSSSFYHATIARVNRLEDENMQDIVLQSLRFPTLYDRYEAIGDAHARTFNWVFEQSVDENKPWDNFAQWLESGDGIYWISGKAGSGKSTLMRYIREDERLQQLLQTWAGEHRDLVIATFFFWISGVPDQSSQVGLLRSLLLALLNSRRHLIKSTLPDLWAELDKSISPHEYSRTYTWTLAKVTRGFQQLFSQDIGHVFLLIDGLDEYQGDPSDTVNLLKSIISRKVKLCLSSRPWQIFEDSFQRMPKLRLQDLTCDDVAYYVNDKLLNHEKMQKLYAVEPVEAPKLVSEIVFKACGVFLWVTLVVKSFLHGLRNGDRISHLRKRLEEIPSALEELYIYMLNKIEPVYYEEGSLILTAVSLTFHKESNYIGGGICAVHLSFVIGDDESLAISTPIRRLSQEETICRVDWVANRLRVCCAGLLELCNAYSENVGLGDFGNRPVQYIHRTAKDFLATTEAKATPIGKYHSTTYYPPTQLMRANVLYLKYCPLLDDSKMSWREQLREIIQKTMWLASEAEKGTNCEYADIIDELERFVHSFMGPLKWGNLLEYQPQRLQEADWCDDFLSLAISWGLDFYIAKKLGNGKDVLQNKQGRPYLDYALRPVVHKPQDRWNLKIITLLLEHGGNPNLKYASGAKSSVSVLLRSTPWEAVLSWTSQNPPVPATSSLLKAPPTYATFYHDLSFTVAFFELLLKYGADPHAQIPNSQSLEHPFISVSDIINMSLAFFPGEAQRLQALLQDEKKRKQQMEKNLKSLKGRIFQFTAKLKARN